MKPINHIEDKDSVFIIDKDKLKPGDIILTRGNHMLSKLIRLATAGDFSHAIIYVGGSSYIDSTGDGVHANNLQRLLFQSKNDCKILRYKDQLSNETITKIVAYSRQLIGTRYSRVDAIRSGPLPNVSKRINENRQFCSRLVAQSYKSAGLTIVKNPELPKYIQKRLVGSLQ